MLAAHDQLSPKELEFSFMVRRRRMQDERMRELAERRAMLADLALLGDRVEHGLQ
jgi:hypothetical protein